MLAGTRRLIGLIDLLAMVLFELRRGQRKPSQWFWAISAR
jgi:hypothetical protein